MTEDKVSASQSINKEANEQTIHDQQKKIVQANPDEKTQKPTRNKKKKKHNQNNIRDNNINKSIDDLTNTNSNNSIDGCCDDKMLNLETNEDTSNVNKPSSSKKRRERGKRAKSSKKASLPNLETIMSTMKKNFQTDEEYLKLSSLVDDKDFVNKLKKLIVDVEYHATVEAYDKTKERDIKVSFLPKSLCNAVVTVEPNAMLGMTCINHVQKRIRNKKRKPKDKILGKTNQQEPIVKTN